MKSDKIVTTVSGQELERSKVRKIGGEYHKIGDKKIKNSGDCYEIDGKFFRDSTGYIVYDHRIQEYAIYNSDSFYKGVIGFDDENSPIIEFFSVISGLNDSIQVNIKGITHYAVNESIFKKSNYREDLATGIYYDRKNLDSYRFVNTPILNSSEKFNLPYDSRGVIGRRMKMFDTLKPHIKVDKYIEDYASNLKDLTFGLEFETTNGFVPDRVCKKNGLISLRDGSISGLEYVTIPLKGGSGLNALLNSLKELDKRTTFDDSCSLHLHIGNIPRTEEFILALFKTLCILQDEIFSLFPLYKKYNFNYKRKHYTKPIPLKSTLLLLDSKIDESNIKENFDILFQFLSMGIPYSNYESNLDKVTHHPSDPRGTSKWNIKTRYFWMNIIPLIFGNKETVEFRIHTPTYDVSKVINYLFLCSSIVNYVKDNTKKILQDKKTIRDMSLNTVIFESSMDIKIQDQLIDYISKRKSYTYSQNSKGGDPYFEESKMCNFRKINFDLTKKSKHDLPSGFHQAFREGSADSRRTEELHRRLEEAVVNLRDSVDE